jgi:protein-tyrosine phosphatase
VGGGASESCFLISFSSLPNLSSLAFPSVSHTFPLQAPISSTVHDFLSLLLTPPTSLAYQSSRSNGSSSSSNTPPPLPLIRTIVQLTPLVESRREKCHPYFPLEVGETWDVPSESEEKGQGVWVKLESKVEKDGARTSQLRVGQEGSKEGRIVTHLEYLGWRDHGALTLFLFGLSLFQLFLPQF